MLPLLTLGGSVVLSVTAMAAGRPRTRAVAFVALVAVLVSLVIATLVTCTERGCTGPEGPSALLFCALLFLVTGAVVGVRWLFGRRTPDRGKRRKPS